MNRATFSQAILAVGGLCLALFSCGGGGEELECLPAGYILTFTETLTRNNGAANTEFVMKVFGNGTDSPEVSIMVAAPAEEPTAKRKIPVVYRRSGNQAQFQMNAKAQIGAYTDEGPVVVPVLGEVSMTGTIVYKGSPDDRQQEGDFAGDITVIYTDRVNERPYYSNHAKVLLQLQSVASSSNTSTM